jgi:plastocyanin
MLNMTLTFRTPVAHAGVVLALALALAACGGGDETEPAAAGMSPSPPPKAPAPTATATPVQTMEAEEGTSGLKTVTVLNKDLGGSGAYEFDPKDLTFSVGETVVLEIVAETEFHTFTVDELEIDEAVDAGETVNYTHTFDTAGTYRLYCIVHEALGMEGTITVQ